MKSAIWEKRISIIIVSSFLLILIGNEIRKKIKIKNEQDYTIGTVFKQSHGFKQAYPSVEYFFFLNGIKFEGKNFYDYDKHKFEIGKKYLVLFSPDEPQNCRILLNIRLPDNVIAPSDGWRNAPFGIVDTFDLDLD